MPYAEKNSEGAIVALYAAQQVIGQNEDQSPIYADYELVADDDPEVIAFLNPVEPVALNEPERLACALRVFVENGEVSEVQGAYNVSSIMRLDTGQFWVFLINSIETIPQLVPNNGIHVGITGFDGTDLFIETRDHAGGAVIDPPEFGFTLFGFEG